MSSTLMDLPSSIQSLPFSEREALIELENDFLKSKIEFLEAKFNDLSSQNQELMRLLDTLYKTQVAMSEDLSKNNNKLDELSFEINVLKEFVNLSYRDTLSIHREIGTISRELILLVSKLL